MNLEQVLEGVRSSGDFMKCATEWREIPPREAVLEDFPDWTGERGTIDEELLGAIRFKKNLADIVTDGRPQRIHFMEHRDQTPGQIEIDWLSGEDASFPDIDGGTHHAGSDRRNQNNPSDPI